MNVYILSRNKTMDTLAFILFILSHKPMQLGKHYWFRFQRYILINKSTFCKCSKYIINNIDNQSYSCHKDKSFAILKC